MNLGLLASLKPKSVPFTELENNKKALAAIDSVARKCNFTKRYQNNAAVYQDMLTGETLALVYCVGIEVSDKEIEFPLDEIKVNDDKSYVGIVVLDNGSPLGVYLVPTDTVLRCGDKKVVKKAGPYAVKLRVDKHDTKAFDKYKFGEVLGQYIKYK